MIYSLALIFLVGLLLASFFDKLKLPRLIGMLIAGIVLGPYLLNLLDASILNISADLRQIALVIILLKAGLSLDVADLKKVGRPALLMAFVPACFEILAFAIFAPMLLNISLIDAVIMGSVLAAVSPAVVVPKMVNLIEQGYGTKKSIPQMILAGASIDDIFVIVIFTTFTGFANGDSFSAINLTKIPVSIILGVLIGGVVGFCVAKIFEHFQNIQTVCKTVILLGLAFMLVSVEHLLSDFVPISGLLAVMCMAIVIKMNTATQTSGKLSQKFSKLWYGAEILLFVLVGASVDIKYAASAGIGVLCMIALALLLRVCGVMLCLVKTKLNIRERLFCMIAYIPKATVQAAIGGIPLAMGLSCGNIVLTVAVTAILITAPLGAIGIDLAYKKLLQKN